MRSHEITENSTGTYAKLVPTNKTRDRISEILGQLCIEATPADKLHTTIIYSRNQCPYAESLSPMFPISAKATGFALFGDNPESKCLVMLLDCVEAEELHFLCRENGASHDYNEYEPHITLSYGYTRDHVPGDELLEYFNHIEFDKFIVEPLEEDWSSK